MAQSSCTWMDSGSAEWEYIKSNISFFFGKKSKILQFQPFLLSDQKKSKQIK